MQNVKNLVTKLKDGRLNPKRRRYHMHCYFFFFLWKQGKPPGEGKKHWSATTPSTQPDQIVDQMQSTWPLSSWLSSTATRFLADQGNRHQQSSNDRTVGVPIQPKHKVPDLIIILGR